MRTPTASIGRKRARFATLLVLTTALALPALAPPALAEHQTCFNWTATHGVCITTTFSNFGFCPKASVSVTFTAIPLGFFRVRMEGSNDWSSNQGSDIDVQTVGAHVHQVILAGQDQHTAFSKCYGTATAHGFLSAFVAVEWIATNDVNAPAIAFHTDNFFCHWGHGPTCL